MNTRIKSAIIIALLALIVFGLFNAVVFLLASNYDGNFWCGYVIVSVAWLCLLIVSLLAVAERKIENGYMLNVPSIIVSVIHFIIQFIIAVFTMSIKAINIKFSIVASLIIIVVYLIIIVSLEVYKSKSRQ